MRAVVREYSRRLEAAPARDIVAVALALAKRRVVEGRQAGYELIGRRKDAIALLTTRLVRQLGAGNDNWASVDGFAMSVSGPAWAAGRVSDRDVHTWARS